MYHRLEVIFITDVREIREAFAGLSGKWKISEQWKPIFKVISFDALLKSPTALSIEQLDSISSTWIRLSQPPTHQELQDQISTSLKLPPQTSFNLVCYALSISKLKDSCGRLKDDKFIVQSLSTKKFLFFRFFFLTFRYHQIDMKKLDCKNPHCGDRVLCSHAIVVHLVHQFPLSKILAVAALKTQNFTTLLNASVKRTGNSQLFGKKQNDKPKKQSTTARRVRPSSFQLSQDRIRSGKGAGHPNRESNRSRKDVDYSKFNDELETDSESIL